MVSVIKAGYRGSATIAGTQVLVTSADMSPNFNMIYKNFIKAPGNGTYTKVYVAPGTVEYGGSISFDVMSGNVAFFYLDEGAITFNVDGTTGVSLSNAKFTSVSMSGAPNGLVTGSVSFTSNQVWTDGGGGISNLKNAVLLGYWQCGNTEGTALGAGIINWSLTKNIAWTPVYVNGNPGDDFTKSALPNYYRKGLTEYRLEVTTGNEQFLYTTIYIGTSKFELKGLTESASMSFGGQNEMGQYTHSFVTAGENIDSTILVP